MDPNIRRILNTCCYNRTIYYQRRTEPVFSWTSVSPPPTSSIGETTAGKICLSHGYVCTIVTKLHREKVEKTLMVQMCGWHLGKSQKVWRVCVGGRCVHNNAAGNPKDPGTGGVLQCGEDRTTDVLYCLKRALLNLAQQYPYHTLMELLKTFSVVLWQNLGWHGKQP